MRVRRGRWSSRVCRIGIAIAVVPSAAVLRAQVAWKDRSPSPIARLGHALAFDIQRGRTVLFGGLTATLRADTWEWDGAIWTLRSPANAPPARDDHAMAYDLGRGCTVLFGGVAGVALADTWEWDGVSWLQRIPAQSPPPRFRHALAYDSARQRTVLFGGTGVAASGFSDTWEWDGSSWQQGSPAASPPARFDHALAFDVARSRTVLFGGRNGAGGLFSDTWEWNGTNWLQRVPAQSPPARHSHGLAHDIGRARTVLFGGTYLGDTWEWDGVTWTQMAPAASPSPRESPLAYDVARGRTVLFGGAVVSGSAPADTWEWDGTNWSPWTVPSPSGRDGTALGHDELRARTLLFGGNDGPSGSRVFGDTWEWDGAGWLLQSPATGPPARTHSALAFDVALGRTLLFGGNDAAFAMFADTWEWDGIGWTQLSPANSPPARTWHALAGDAARGRVVLFGGAGPALGQVFADTWEWDGIGWQQRAPAANPPARCMHALAHDAARGRTVLFGGASSSFLGTALGDTWEWDGTNWSQRVTGGSPPARDLHALAYDAARGRTVLFGGLGGPPGASFQLADAWEWDGTGWTQRVTAASPPARDLHALAYDVARGRTVLFGSFYYPDTWEYGPVVPGTYVPFGTGCAGSAGVPVLAAGSELCPYPGNDLTVEVAPVPASTAVVFSLGLSQTQWGSLSLPFALDGLGMPGCALFASGDATLLRFATGSVASLTIPIPNNQAFVGLAFYAQAFALDPTANAAGATASNAAAATVGSK
jgi:hypothetical protein